MMKKKQSSLYRRALALWGILALLAIMNGAFRGAVLVPALGEEMGRVASTIILSSIILAMSFVLVRRVEVEKKNILFFVGLLWMGMTVVFEFGLGLLILQYPPERVLADYDIFKGRIWILVLLTQLVGPYIMFSFLKKKPEIVQ